MKCLALFLLAIGAFSTPYPGIRTTLSIKSLTSYIQEVLPDIISESESASISPISFWVHPLFIPVKVQLSNFHIYSFTADISKTIVSVNNVTKQIYVTLSNVNLFLTGEYDYYIPFRVGGDFNLTLSNSTLIIPYTIGVDGQGALSLEAGNLLGNTSSLDIQVEPVGFVSTTFMLVTKLWPLSRITRHAMDSMFSKISVLTNPYVNKYLSGIVYTQQVGNLTISGDYHFLMINLDPLYIEAYVNGTFFLNNALDTVSPVVPSNILPNYYSINSARVQLTEYYFDSLMWALYQSNSLYVFIKSQDVPSNFPYAFTTSGLSKIAPGLVTVYGQNVPVNIECSVYKVPNVDIQSTVSITASTGCNFLVQVSPTVMVNAFTLLSTFQTRFQATLKDVDDSIYVVGSLDRTNTLFQDFSVINSKVGTVNVAKISAAFNWYTYYLVNMANNVLEDQGLLVPLPQSVKFQSPSFYCYPGAVEIGFEPVYH